MADLSNILGETGLMVCKQLRRSNLMAGFYLAGGTGLALQLKHRRSLDLDFFQEKREERIPAREVNLEIKRLFGERSAKPVLKQSDQVIWDISGTRVAFIAYPFLLLEPPLDAGTIFKELSGIRVATPREIALMKAYTLGRRANFRDYIDLYFLLINAHITLKEIIEDAEIKFVLHGEKLFSTRLFLEQLTYTEDLEDKDAALNLLLDQTITAREVETFLKGEVSRFLRDNVLRKEPS